MGKATYTIAVAVLCFGSPPLVAQQNAPERIEITGSNLPRTDTETPSPVQVMSADSLRRSGYSTVSEALRSITANGQGTLSQSFVNAFAAGASGLSLRGLTVGGTLILIDGRRIAPYPLADDAQRSFVDISSIPLAAVERIEVLKDGASAIYGSDAVAGVVNVVLQKRISGTTLSGELGGTQRGGGANGRVALTQGFGDEFLGGYLALEARQQNEIKLRQRTGEWAQFDWRAEGGIDLRPGARNPVVLSPRLSTAYLQLPGTSTSDSSNFAFYPGCTHADMQASRCIYENTWSQIQPKTQNFNLIARLSGRQGGEASYNLTASIFDSKSRLDQGPSRVPFVTFGGVTVIGPGVTPRIVSDDLPFTVPAGYPGNTLGAPAGVRAFADPQRPGLLEIDTKTWRLVAEVNGVAGGWDLNGALGLTRAQTKQTFQGRFNYPRLSAALNRAVDPYLVAGGNSAAVLDEVMPVVDSVSTSDLHFVALRATRGIKELPGGPLGLALGVDFRHKRLDQPVPGPALEGTMLIGGVFAEGSENVSSLYAELNAPVVRALELSAAARVDRYNTYGHSATPRFGVKFMPMPELALRGTVSRGFRAPAATEIGNGGSLFNFNIIRDPLLCPTSLPDGSPDLTSATNVPTYCSFNPVYLQVSNKDLRPEKSRSMTLGLIVEPVKGWSTTLDYYRIRVDGQIISAAALSSYDPVAAGVRGAPQLVTFGDGSTGLSSVGPIGYSPVPFVNGQRAETSGLEFETRFKLRLEALGELAFGFQWTRVLKFDQTADGVTAHLAGTHGPSIVGGNTGNPRDRAQLTLGYTRGPFNITATVNRVGAYNVTDPAIGITDCASGITANNAQFANEADPPERFCMIPAFVTTNLVMTYEVGRTVTLRGGVGNLFDRSPPTDLNTFGGSGSNGSSVGSGAPYNPSLHQAGAVGRSFTVGVDWRF